jgi:ribose transport system ATP-binding protein
MDEPTSSLSAPDAARLLDVVQRLREDGRTVVYISHFLEEVAKVADRYTVLRDGRAVATGSMATSTRSELLDHMAGRNVGEAFETTSGAPGEGILELDGVAASLRPRRSAVAAPRRDPRLPDSSEPAARSSCARCSV